MVQSSFQGFLVPRPDNKGGGSNIKSIQVGNTTMGGGTTVNVPITAVDTTKSIIRVHSGGGANIDVGMVQGLFSSSTQVAFNTLAASTVGFNWEVVEYQAVKSFQKGNRNVLAGSNNAPLTAVNPAKTQVFLNSAANASSTNLYEAFVYAYVSNATTLTLVGNASSTVSKATSWFVIEYY